MNDMKEGLTPLEARQEGDVAGSVVPVKGGVGLIERLERATGPDRGLADEVLFACGWTVDHEDHEGVIWRAPNGDLIAGDHNPLASIDAAVSLMPRPGYGFRSATSPRPCSAWAHNSVRTGIWHGATPAIALCIAALNVRLQDIPAPTTDAGHEDSTAIGPSTIG